jgi:hypothetical protein
LLRCSKAQAPPAIAAYTGQAARDDFGLDGAGYNKAPNGGFAPTRHAVGAGWGEQKGLRPERDGGAVCPVVDRPVAVSGIADCARPEPFMTLPRDVADVLSGHLAFELAVAVL